MMEPIAIHGLFKGPLVTVFEHNVDLLSSAPPLALHKVRLSWNPYA